MPTPTEQLLARTSYLGDGVTTVWNFTFVSGYIDRTHVKAYTVNSDYQRTDLVITPANFLGDYQLSIVPAVPVGSTLTIYRDTPKGAPLVDFTDGSSLAETSLDMIARQAVFVSAETNDILHSTTFYADLAAIAERSQAAVNAALSASTSAGVCNAALVALSPYLLDIATVAANLGTISTTVANLPAIAAAPNHAAASAASATSAASSATLSSNNKLAAEAAATAAEAAAASANLVLFNGLGFNASTMYDFGYVNDPVVIHATDYGAIP